MPVQNNAHDGSNPNDEKSHCGADRQEGSSVGGESLFFHLPNPLHMFD